MPATLTLNDAEYEVLHALLKGERDEVHHEIHHTEWKHKDELKVRLQTVESLLNNLEKGKGAKV